MRIKPFLCLIAAVFLAGCAYEGVIVQKNSNPLPFYETAGIEGSYAFLLRDTAGVVRRQIVTPEVFQRYAIGDYFNDLQRDQTGNRGDGKTMMSNSMNANSSSASVKKTQIAARKSGTSVSRTASVRKPSKARHLASKRSHKRHRPLAAKRKRSRTTKSAVTVATVTPISQPKAPAAKLDNVVGVIAVARCR